MARIALTLVLVVVVITVQGLPTSYDEVLLAAKAGQWDQVQHIIHSDLAKQAAIKPATFDSVRNLKPPQGGHVYGQAEYAFHSASNINGKTSEDKGGHKVFNYDGKVKEFDFTPNTQLSPHALLPFNGVPSLNPSQGSNVYSGTSYAFQSSSAFDGKMSEENDHQPIGNYRKDTGLNFTPGTQNLALSPQTFNGVRNLKPPQGGQAFGQAEYAFHSASNINGKTSEDHFGHKIINNNGDVKEFDFIPSPEKVPLLPQTFTSVRNLKPPQGGEVYGEAEYAFHSASNINGKTSEDHFGHKLINNNGEVKEFDFTPSPSLQPQS